MAAKPKLIQRLAGSAGLALALGFGVQANAAAPILPSGSSIVAGSAAVSTPGANNTLIQQSSQKAVINWQDFSIGSGATVTFQQPGSSAITLNRVVGPGASALNGNLFANGQVWLVNSNGILFGPGSRTDLGGLIATTSDIADSDFLGGKYAFSTPSTNPDASVVNAGSITIKNGGSAVLSAARVANSGVIEANLGYVVLGAAAGFSVDFDGDNLIRYAIAAPVTQTPNGPDGKPAPDLVANSGTISAQGGKVLMTTRAVRDVLDNVINTTGIVEATSASVQNGEIVLDAGDSGTVKIGGTLDASGKNTGETGGTIAVSGDTINVADGARLDASGASGGGSVLIGRSPDPADAQPTARVVSIGNAQIAADATDNGNGGTVAIAASSESNVDGSISAKAGPNGGDGGSIETSGAQLNLAQTLKVDTSAPNGTTGSWLLDPTDVTVDAAYASVLVANLATTNQLVSATNDINVVSQIKYNSAYSLAFLAQHDINFYASVQNAGAGSIIATAGWNGTTAGNGGSIQIGGASASGYVAVGSASGTTTIAALNLGLTATNGYSELGYHGDSSGSIVVNLTGSLTLTGGSSGSLFAQIGDTGSVGGNIHIDAARDVTLDGGRIGNSGIINVGAVSVAAAGNITLETGALINANGSGDALVLASGGDFVNEAGNLALNVTGGGRWLIFLSDPTNNTPDGLTALPFYNRAFDFSTDSYAAVTSSGDRFVYALAPVLTVTADDKSKVYGAANPPLTATITGLVGGDSLADAVGGAPSLASAATATSNAGDYAIVASSGTLFSDLNYGFQYVNGTLHIDPATLSAALTGTVEKTYDGTTTATLAAGNYQLTGVIGGDAVTLNDPTTGTYDTKDVGTGKLVTVTGLALSGAQSGNYTLASTSISGAVGTIDAATLNVALTGTVEKTYDGTTDAILAAGNYELTGVIGGDAVTLNDPTTGTYDTKNVGTGKTVTVSGLALSGVDSGNYTLSSTTISGAVGTIDAATLNVALTGTVEKTYDGTTTATLTAADYQLNGVIGEDQVALNDPTAGTYDTKDVGTGKTVTVNGLALTGADMGNYIISSSVSGAVGTIDAATLNVALTGTVEKTYDGTTDATLASANYQFTGLIGGDAVMLNSTSASYDTKAVGSGKTVTVNGLALAGADSGNYILGSNSVSGAVGIIDPALLSVGLTGTVEKTYDATTTATLTAANYQLTGVIGGDTVTINHPTTGTYDTKNVGTGKTVTVTGLALSGADSADYTLASASVSGAVGIIDPAMISAALTGTVEKTYDGTTAATLTAANYQLNGVIGGDTVTLSPTSASYDTKNVGTGKIVTVTGLALSGADRGNYMLSSTSISGPVGIVDAATLNVALTGTVEKTYDATTAATLAAGNYKLTGVIGGDAVTLNDPTTGNYDTKNVGTGKTVTVTGLALSGADAGNYLLPATSVSGAVGKIDPATLNVALTGTVEKTYDGTTAATLTPANYVLTGVIGGDSVTLNDLTIGSYDTGDVGTGKTVTVTGLALSGAEMGNYILSSPSVSGPVGIIDVASVIDNGVLTDLITRPIGSIGSTGSNAPIDVTTASFAPAATPTTANDATSATSDTNGGTDAVNAAANKLGNSLDGIPGTVSSATTVLIQGLLQQFNPPPGGLTPSGAPPSDQIYSSWGNEAFWQ
jgi:filamentous hemagglutinin family protein